MDAPRATSERTRELAELRSRAYGPDADIDRDADALARLIELEDLARTDAPAAEADGPEQGGSPEAAPAAPTPPEAAEDRDEKRAATPRPWWRRTPVWAYIAVAACIGLGVGLAMPALAPPHPVATLRQAPPADGVELDFDMYGIPAESPVRYEPFRDLGVWSAVTEQGSTCVVITAGDEEWMAAGCAPAPLNPTADITYYPGMRGIEGLELSDGSVVRFILRGDVMEVWLAETDEAA